MAGKVSAQPSFIYPNQAPAPLVGALLFVLLYEPNARMAHNAAAAGSRERDNGPNGRIFCVKGEHVDQIGQSPSKKPNSPASLEISN